MDNRFEFPGGNGLITALQFPIYWQGEALAFELAHLSLSSELYIYTSVSAQLNFHTAMRFP